MISFKEATEKTVRLFLRNQQGCIPSYPEVGASRSSLSPPGYSILSDRIKLGTGVLTFEKAKSAIQKWKMFDFSWIKLFWPNTPIEEGRDVAILVRVCGLYFLNACRIVYVIDTDGPTKRFGFAYGTLPGHVESGEERFLVEWNKDDDSVWYEVYSFSRPSRFCYQIATPYLRKLQKHFILHSLRAIQKEISEGSCE